MLEDLSRTPIAETLRRLSAERRSGDLQVQSRAGVKTVYFDHGRLVFAASSLRDDRLGESLVDAGRITELQFKEATALMEEHRQRFGEALMAAGVMDKQELGRSVARQVRRIVLSLFPLTDSIASFEDRACAVPIEYMVTLSLHHLLYQGIRRMTDVALVTRGIGRLDRRVTLADVPPFRLTVSQCTAFERELLGRCRSRPSLLRLVEGEGDDGVSFERLRVAYAFLAGGVLRDAAELDNAQPVMQADEEGFLLSPMQRQPEAPAADAQRAEIAAELTRSVGDHEEWLSVSQSASVTDILPALRRKIDRYHDLHKAVEDDAPLRTDVELILGRAYALARRLRTAEPRPRSAGVAAAATVARTIESASTPAQARVLTPDNPVAMPVAPPGALTRKPLLESAPGATRGPGLVPTPAFGTVATAAPVSATPASLEPVQASGDPTPTAAPPPPVVAAPAATHERASSTSSDDGEIQQLLSSGNIQMIISDYANAVQTYSELVDRAPMVAAHHLRLAVAMALWPQTKKNAEREFHEALRLDPESVDTHFQLALYYKKMKLRARALEQFRIALSLNPQHKRARQEIELLSPKDSALTSLRNLFR